MEPNRTKVLIVSQDKLFGRIVRMKLESWGFVARHEETPTPAMEWFRLDLFRIVLVDLDLPDQQGIDLIREIRDFPRPGYTYVIGYSASTDKELLMTGLEAGLDDFALKPFHPAELRLRLSRAVEALQRDDLLFSGGGTDPSTGLINRTAFETFLQVLLAQANRSQFTGVLMFVSLADPQDIVRRFGFQGLHDTDLAIAEALGTTTRRQSDLLAKLGEGDFCILLHGTDLERAAAVRARLVEAFKDFAVTLDEVAVQPRIGLAEIAYPAAGMVAADYLAPQHRQAVATLVEGAVPEPGLRGRSGLI